MTAPMAPERVPRRASEAKAAANMPSSERSEKVAEIEGILFLAKDVHSPLYLHRAVFRIAVSIESSVQYVRCPGRCSQPCCKLHPRAVHSEDHDRNMRDALLLAANPGMQAPNLRHCAGFGRWRMHRTDILQRINSSSTRCRSQRGAPDVVSKSTAHGYASTIGTPYDLLNALLASQISQRV